MDAARIALLAGLGLLGGCLSFGPEASTTQPTAEQLARCRAEMYLRPDVDVKALGFKLIQGIDAAIWFKAEVPTADPARLFRTDVVDIGRLGEPTELYRAGDLPAWWDPPPSGLLGGQVALPNARFMNVGILPRPDGKAVLYVMWHET